MWNGIMIIHDVGVEMQGIMMVENFFALISLWH